eukprot:718870-Hanusia_phi.AAC.1
MQKYVLRAVCSGFRTFLLRNPVHTSLTTSSSSFIDVLPAFDAIDTRRDWVVLPFLAKYWMKRTWSQA